MPAALPPDEPTVAWDLAKVLLVASAAAFLIAAWFALRPVENPGVQDCGAPLRFIVNGEEDVVVPIGVPGAPPNAPELRTQEPCSSLVVPELERAGLFTVACVVLGLTGAALGLIDDRIRLRRAPRFEQLVRERPADAPVRALDPVPTRPEDLGEALPAIEPVELALLALGAVLAFVGLPVLVGADGARSALDEVGISSVLALVVIVAVARAAAGVGRWASLDLASPLGPAADGAGGRAPRAADEPGEGTGPALRRWLTVTVATGWAARARPETGVYGVDVHHLVKAEGVDRSWAVARVGTAATMALLVHLASMVVVAVGGLPEVAEPDDRAYLLLLGGCAVGALLGLGRAPRVLRAQAVLPSKAGLADALRASVRPRALAAVGSAVVQIALEVAVVVVAVAAVGGSVPLRVVALAWLLAVSVGVASPLPAGVGLTEAVLALLLWRWGLGPGEAVAAALLARAATFWLPMAPGWWTARRLAAQELL